MVQAERITKLRCNRIFPEIVSNCSVLEASIYLFAQFRNLAHLFLTNNLTSIIRFSQSKSCNIHQKFHHLLLECTTSPILVTMFVHQCSLVVSKSCSTHFSIEHIQTLILNTNISVLLRLLTLFRHKSHHSVRRSHLHRVLRSKLFRNRQAYTCRELEHIKNIAQCEVVPKTLVSCIHNLRMNIFIIKLSNIEINFYNFVFL